MSAFSSFFGKKRTKTDTKTAKEKLTDTINLMQKKAEFLEKKIEEEISTAKRYGLNNKKLALKALQRKRFYENQLKRVDNTIVILENQMVTIDNAGMNLEVLEAMKTASASLKQTHKNMNIDEVHKMMDETQEQREIAQEIADAISDPSAYGIDYDGDELLDELNAMMSEEMEERLTDVHNISDLPSVPTDQLPERTKDNEAELEELMSWAQ